MRGVDFSEADRFSGGGGDNGGSFISLPYETFVLLIMICHNSEDIERLPRFNPIMPFYIGLRLTSIWEMFEHGVSWYRKTA